MRSSRRSFLRQVGVPCAAAGALHGCPVHRWLVEPVGTLFRARIRVDGLPLSNEPFRLLGDSGRASELGPPGADRWYRVQGLHLDLDAPDVLALTDGESVLWGPRHVPAGVARLACGCPGSGVECGLSCAAGRSLRLSVDLGFHGIVEIFGHRLPAGRSR